MDALSLNILLIIAPILTVAIFFLAVFKSRQDQKVRAEPLIPRNEGQANVVQPPRRAAVARNARARMRAAAVRQQESDDEDQALQDIGEEIELPDGKIGKKKLAKLQAKADKRVQRDADEREREERKKRQAKEEEDRKKTAQAENEEEKRREAEERAEQEEKTHREHEEYLIMKEAFSIEEEGFGEEEVDDPQNLLQMFINYIKSVKVVLLEDLAAHFKLKTQEAIDRVQALQAEGALTGVIDDRGKFIYIPREELETVAKFIRQRGRVSLAELAESSNNLINLIPDNKQILRQTAA